jgi:hypothetical protein
VGKGGETHPFQARLTTAMHSLMLGRYWANEKTFLRRLVPSLMILHKDKGDYDFSFMQEKCGTTMAQCMKITGG